MVMISIFFTKVQKKDNIFSVFIDAFGKINFENNFNSDILWFDNFCVRFLEDILEIIIFNESISCDEMISKIYKDILLGDEAMITIRKGSMEYQFWSDSKFQLAGI